MVSGGLYKKVVDLARTAKILVRRISGKCKDQDDHQNHDGMYVIREEAKLCFSVCELEVMQLTYVALIPPKIVYRTTPTGRRKQAAAVGIPVSEVTTAEPPVNSMAVTKILVMRPKTVNTRCAYMPYLALIASRNVCAFGARRLSAMAIVAKSRIWTVAPEAYQKGPETP